MNDVEIFPGLTIVIDQTAQRMVGFRADGRSRRAHPVTNKQLTKLFASIMSNKGHKKYSDLILDEAVALKRLTSAKHAEEVTGVKRWSILEHERKKQILAEGTITTASNRGMKYTVDQKKQCVLLALQLMSTGRYKKGAAFKEAGKRTGVNGASIYYQWFQGWIPGVPTRFDIQQPAKAYEVVSAYSTKAAIPQAQP